MITIIEPGQAITKQQIQNLKSYTLGYINYESPQQQPCAVKVIQLDKDYEARFFAQREKEALMRVEHQNIAQTYKIIEQNNKMYIFKEYEEQITLENLSKDSRISELMKDVLKLGIELIHCLNYMELLSLTNRDLNPANILLNRERVFKTFDFGSSIIMDDKQIQQTMFVGGNDFFMSPQILGIGELDETNEPTEINYYKSDIWSLENQYPWRKDIQNADLDDEIEKIKSRPIIFEKIKSDQLKKLIRQMLTYDQDQRSSASELAKLYPSRTILEIQSGLNQKLKKMKTQYELDYTYQDLIFNNLIRYFTQNIGSEIYQSYHDLLDYQMFNKKELWQEFKIHDITKKLLLNFVNEYKGQSKLNDRQQDELLLLLQTIDCQKTFSDNSQQLIEMIEKEYIED